MATINDDEYVDSNRTRSNVFYRSLSPYSFERLRTEHNDYFYKPKRGPSTSRSNITITRPIKTFATVSKLVELLSKENSHTNRYRCNDIFQTYLYLYFIDIILNIDVSKRGILTIIFRAYD